MRMVAKCVNCDVSLVYHKNSRAAPLPLLQLFSNSSPALPCVRTEWNRIFGYGTEKNCGRASSGIWGYRVARMNLDTTRNKDAYREIIEEFARHETDILVGTQMVCRRSLDFGDVRTVKVLNADTLLNFPRLPETWARVQHA